MKSKKLMAIVATMAILFSSQIVPLWASPSSIGTINNGEKVYAPVNTIVQQMGGTVQRDEANKFYTFTINGKNIRIDDKWSFAEVDGKIIPYETRTLGGFTIPVFKKPIIKDGNVYVPVDFLKESVGLKLDVKDDKVTFDAVGDGNSTTSVATVKTPSTIGTQPTTNGGTGVIESNRPAPKSTPTSNTDTITETTPKPSTPTHAPVYNGSEIAKKLSDIGFYYGNGSYFLNKYGQQGASQFDYVGYTVHSGDTDMNLSVMASTPEIDQKIKTILNWILPTQGSYLYNLMDNPNFKSQTLELDGRTITIRVEKTFVSINFSPIK